MRSFDPDDEYDRSHFAKLNAAPWMVYHLSLNPTYTCWGPGEDSMAVASADSGTVADSMELDAWSKFGPWALDEYNECANFYFELDRDSKKCDACENGYSPQATRFQNEWYGKADPPFDPRAYGVEPLSIDHPDVRRFAEKNVDANPRYFGVVIGSVLGSDFEVDSRERAIAREMRRLHAMWSEQWHHHLNQADVDALVAGERLWALKRAGTAPTPDSVNAWSLTGMGHDSINASICLRARCAREGVPVSCSICGGSGYQYTAPAAHLNLVVWMLHPRKGCSRGIRIKNLSRDDAAAARAWLREAAVRNAERFAKVVEVTL